MKNELRWFKLNLSTATADDHGRLLQQTATTYRQHRWLKRTMFLGLTRPQGLSAILKIARAPEGVPEGNYLQIDNFLQIWIFGSKYWLKCDL